MNSKVRLTQPKRECQTAKSLKSYVPFEEKIAGLLKGAAKISRLATKGRGYDILTFLDFIQDQLSD